MIKRRCKNKNCRCLFIVNPKHPNQQYCSKKKCQRLRKTIWQREKMSTDEQYRENQADSQKRWLAKKPGYWKRYRKKNPGYTKQNREKQRGRDQLKRDSNADASILQHLAKMDASNVKKQTISGIYTIKPVGGSNLAKMDVLKVRISEISTPYS